MRPVIAGLDRSAERRAARAGFGLDPDLPTLLVFGGSQGARRLNEAVVAAAPALALARVQVLHAAGPANVEAVTAALPSPTPGVPYVVAPYLQAMELAYAAADLALCRAGAMTCAELSAVGLPAVYVPLAIGNGEQRLNAAGVVAAGGGVEVLDGALDGATVISTVLPLVTDPQRLAAMSAAAARFGRRDADVALARLVLAAAGERRR